MEKHKIGDVSISLPGKLTDVGSFSYSCLCGVCLLQLYDDEWNRDFKKKAIDKILHHLKLPDQAHESVKAITQGEGIDDPQPYADIVLQEPCLRGSGLPVVTDLITLSLMDGHYDSRMRTLIKHVAWQLRVSWDHIEEVEVLMAETLEARQYEMSEEEQKEKQKKHRKQKITRYALIGIATVGGGALIGLTGGLAAPLVAAGASAIIGGAGAAALGTTAGVAIIGSLFGVAGAGLAGHKMHKRFGAIEEFAFEPMITGGVLQRASTAKQLHITIAVTGWLSRSMRDVKIPWKNLAESQEQYSLRYESKHLSILGDAFEMILSGAVSMATQEALKYTVLSGIISAIAWPAALISAANVIDNPWGVCLQRSVTVGKELAETLLAREQGNRPVTLIGYSLGARVIFYCLEEMSKRKCCEGIVEDVILLGAPVTGDPKTWSHFGRVVAGKIVNGYSKADWLLKFLYRTSSVQFTVAGLQPIKWNNRRMHNIDLSDIVSGHGEYLKQLDTIMKVVGLRTKQDVTIKPITSLDMVAGTNNLESLTSSEEEESEEPAESNGKKKKKKSHQECVEKQESEETEKHAAADTTQMKQNTPSHDQGSTSSNQSEQVLTDQQVLAAIKQLELAETSTKESAEPENGLSEENAKCANGKTISGDDQSENVETTDEGPSDESKKDQQNAVCRSDSDDIPVQTLESSEPPENDENDKIKEIDSAEIANHSIRSAGIRDLPDEDMDSFEILQPNCEEVGTKME